jgi:excisionase family DNA binding protein
MAAAALKQETYLPEDGDQVAEVYDFLTAHEATGRSRPAARYFLSGTEPGDRIELPAELYRLLRQVVEALQRGLAVTVAPQTMTVTTQEAADLLGVSRPTVVKLLGEHKIPYERVGSHRKILLRDLLEYRERRRAGQYAALEATAMSVDDEEGVEAMLDRLREARRVVAERRRRPSDA